MSRMLAGNRRGFTLIEVIVVAAIIAILAGILVPMIFNQIDEAKITRAAADCKSIQTAIMAFRKDTGKWPAYAGGTYPCTTTVDGILATVLTTDGGNQPTIAGAGWDTSGSLRLAILVNEASACYPVPSSTTVPGWKGPYANAFSADPWGNKYYVNAKDFETPGVPVWVISAGPDGILQTDSTATKTLADDIGMIIKQ